MFSYVYTTTRNVSSAITFTMTCVKAIYHPLTQTTTHPPNGEGTNNPTSSEWVSPLYLTHLGHTLTWFIGFLLGWEGLNLVMSLPLFVLCKCLSSTIFINLTKRSRVRRTFAEGLNPGPSLLPWLVHNLPLHGHRFLCNLISINHQSQRNLLFCAFSEAFL